MFEIENIIGIYYPFDMNSQILLMDIDHNIVDVIKVKTVDFKDEVIKLIKTHPDREVELYGISSLLEGLFKDSLDKYKIKIGQGENK